jgi:hypothetical protein
LSQIALLYLNIRFFTTGKANAAQAIARIGISTAPSIAFPGQRMYEAVKPLLLSLDLEKSGLENFESLLALCNIAGESESCRRRIFDEKGYMQIEHYAYEKHTKLRMAAVQCICNLALSDLCVKVQLFSRISRYWKHIFLSC